MDNLRAEEAAHLGPGGPAEVVVAWVSAVVDHARLDAAWDITAWPLRLALVQSWMLAERVVAVADRDELAHGLSELGVGHPAWQDFVTWRVDRWRNVTFDQLLAGWGVVTVAEVVGPDLEFVRVASCTGTRQFRPGEALEVNTFTVQFIDRRWLVAGIGRSLPVPGWPPTEQCLPSPNAG